MTAVRTARATCPLICWPRMAFTSPSSTEVPCGTRKPRCMAVSGDRKGSPPAMR